MSMPTRFPIMPILAAIRQILLWLTGMMTISTFAQMQWNAYDANGDLVTTNVAVGGDLISGSAVTFTIPANTQLSFITKSFTPFSLAGANAKKLVTFNVLVSAGFGGVGQRTMGWGLYNSAKTASLADDVGYFGLWNGGGPYLETYDHPSGSPSLFSGTQLGEGKSDSGTPSDGVVYTNQIQLVMNSSANGISLGTSSSTLASAGLGLNGAGVAHRAYTNPVNGPLGGATLFDEFGFMFNNTTANPITVTLSAISLGNSLTWDASGANPLAPTDGAGNWSITNATWSGGSGDSVWSSGYSAVFGSTNGAAGIITITDPTGVTVSNITFNAATSGSYSITGSSLILTGTPTINVSAGVVATNSSQLGGTGFIKAGSGTLVLLPSAAATNVGATVVNAGMLFLAGTGFNSLNDDLIVNAGAAVQIAASLSIPSASRLFINGGSVTNVSGSNPTLNYNIVAIDNGGFIGSAGTQIGQLNVTNFDFRSGTEAFAKFPASMTTNFSVKSTPGTMIVQSRANSSGANGIAGLKLNAGTFICDYPNPAPNNDTTGGAKYINTAQMTLAGGTLFQRFNAIANRTETVGGVLINPGATSVIMTNNSSGNNSYTFAQGAITRSVGGTVDYSSGGSSTGTKAITTTTANVNGILGGYATFGGNDWAIGATVAPYSAYATSADPTTWTAANNVSLSGNLLSNINDGTSINSLKINTAATITLNGALTLVSGGLLATGTGADLITGGTLLGNSGADLIVHQYSSGDLTVNSTLADNGSATSLTKSGPGKLVINGANTMTGNNYLNGGTVEVGSLAQLAAGSLVMNNGTLRYTGSNANSMRQIILNGSGGTIDVAGSAQLVQSATIVGGGGFNSPLTPGLNLGDWGGLTKIGTGTLVLAFNNAYNGPTVVSNGVLSVNGTNSLTGISGLTNYFGGGSFTIYGGTLSGSGFISGAVDIKNSGTLEPGTGTLTLASSLTFEGGSTNLIVVNNQAMDGPLSINGNLVIQSNSIIAISILGTALEPTTNTLMTYMGSKTGSFNPAVVIIGGSVDGSVSIDDSTPGQIKLVVAPQVVITSQPANLTVSTNDPATFGVVATGLAPLAYQWYRYADINGTFPTLETGATNSSFIIASAQTSDSGYYGVTISNNYNSVTSSIATLIVGNVTPSLSGPTNETVIAGNSVTFSTTVVLANPAPVLQWQTNGINVAGATGSALTLNNVPSADDGMLISIIATNAAGSVTNFATLAVIVAPTITPQPTNLTVNAGSTAVFSSGATGVPAPSLQWYENNAPIIGQTGNTLTIANVQGSNIASYKLVAANAAGSVTSSVVTLTVNSTALTSTALVPVNGTTGVCYDTPLYVTFNNPITIVNSGKIRIYNSTNSTTPVDTIDMSSNSVVISSGIGLTNNIQPHSLFSGDSQVINYFPVIISGSTAAIYPHLGVLTSNQTYYVTMDNGIVADSTGAYFSGVSDTNSWRFTTKPTGPANATNLVVAVDGSGDFVTVQGAVDSVPPGNTNYTLVNIHDGNYVEIVDVSGKNNITFSGQSRAGTVVGYANNNNLTGTTAARMAFKVNSSDIKLENLTLTNGTPQGGSQAETLLIYNNGLRCVVDNCNIDSRQDTILINASTSQGYFNNCRIVGNFDYVWGVGVGYFNNCVFHTITNSLSGSYNLTAARTLTAGTLSAGTPWVDPNGTTYSANGFSFVNCTLEADTGVTNITLADSNGTAGGLDSWINCLIDTNAYANPLATLTNQYVFWQYSNMDITGINSISYANLVTIGMTNNDPRLLAATNIVTWFSGWSPQLAPNIINQPADQVASAGQSVTFNVSAIGIPDPTYQWLVNGSSIGGLTNSSFTISNTMRTNVGNYSVVVSNGSGSITSSVATLTYDNTSPVAGANFLMGSLINIPTTIQIIGGKYSPTDPDNDALTIISVSGATNGIVTTDGTNVAYTATNGTSDSFTYTVSDGFGGTASATVSVAISGNTQGYNQLSMTSFGNGTNVVTFLGIPDYNYALDLATNLLSPINWLPQATNPAANNGYLVFTNISTAPQSFYRTRYVH